MTSSIKSIPNANPLTEQKSIEIINNRHINKNSNNSTPESILNEPIPSTNHDEYDSDDSDEKKTENNNSNNNNNNNKLPETLITIEKEANKYYKSQMCTTPKAYHLKHVPIKQIYLSNPDIAWSPTGKSTFYLGNRVSILRSDAGIPFGTQGTIVGIHDTFVVIITDTNVIKGNTLHNRCSDHRGIILPHTSVIKLTPNEKPIKFDNDDDDTHNNKNKRSTSCPYQCINDNTATQFEICSQHGMCVSDPIINQVG